MTTESHDGTRKWEKEKHRKTILAAKRGSVNLCPFTGIFAFSKKKFSAYTFAFLVVFAVHTKTIEKDRNCYSSEIRTIENQAHMRYIVLDAGKRKKTKQNKQKKLCNFCGRSYICSVSLLAQHPLREKKNWLKSISWQDSYIVNTRGVARWEDTRGDRKPLSFCSTGSLRFPFLRSFNLLWV